MRKRKPVATRTKSNTWALVAAVLVATFSLLFNHLFRITPDKIDVMMSSLKSVRQVSHEFVSKITATEESTGIDGVRSAKQIVKDLEQIEPILDAYFTAFARGQTGFGEKVEQAGAIIRSANTDLELQRDVLPADQLREVRMTIFEGLFLIAGMRPDLYTQDLEEAAERLLADPELPSSEPFDLLLAYHELHLHKDSPEVVLEKLRDYSTQRDDKFAIKLYALVASGMKKFDRRQLSAKVLRQGMEIYAEHEDRSRLVNVLIDLKVEGLSPR